MSWTGYPEMYAPTTLPHDAAWYGPSEGLYPRQGKPSVMRVFPTAHFHYIA
jgi:hypothetical protein